MTKAFRLLVGASVLALAALAYDPSPAEAGVCDGLTGKAMGICMAATQGVNCDQAEPSATNKACDRLAEQYTEATGEAAPPWLVYGLDVLIKVDGSPYFLDPGLNPLQAQGNAWATQDPDTGAISLLLGSNCVHDSCGVNAAILGNNSFPTGSFVEIEVLNTFHLPDDNLASFCVTSNLLHQAFFSLNGDDRTYAGPGPLFSGDTMSVPDLTCFVSNAYNQ